MRLLDETLSQKSRVSPKNANITSEAKCSWNSRGWRGHTVQDNWTYLKGWHFNRPFGVINTLTWCVENSGNFCKESNWSKQISTHNTGGSPWLHCPSRSQNQTRRNTRVERGPPRDAVNRHPALEVKSGSGVKGHPQLPCGSRSSLPQ